MAISIESYINSNEQTVNKWLINLFSKYVEKLLLKKEDTTVYLDYVCRDDRRVHKCREVLIHYGLIEKIEWKAAGGSYFARQASKDWYLITLNHQAFLEMAPKFAEPFAFELKAPEKSTDRIKGYPTLDNIDMKGILHIYLNPDEYVIYDRMETHMNTYSYKKGAEPRRCVRVYPKNLESDAELKVFKRTLNAYYEHHVEKLVPLMFGFEPEVLTHESRYGDEDLKFYNPGRTNVIGNLDRYNPIYIQEQITATKELLRYGKAALRDLEKLQEGLKKYPKHGDFRKDFEKKAEEYSLVQAPLMMSSEEKLAKKLATLLLKGSNKGLI